MENVLEFLIELAGELLVTLLPERFRRLFFAAVVVLFGIFSVFCLCNGMPVVGAAVGIVALIGAGLGLYGLCRPPKKRGKR